MSFTDPAFVQIYEQIDGDRTIDLDFYRGLAREAKGKILEAGCGSGRVLLKILMDSGDIEGFDPSKPMLDLLYERAIALGCDPHVWQGDFDSITGKQSLVISPFNSIMHLLDQDLQIEAFKRVYDSLTDDGVFAFDIVNPYTLDIYDDSRQFESTMTDAATGRTTEIWRWFEHDPIAQIGRYHREFLSEGSKLHSVIDFRWGYPSEVALLLKMAGFNSYQVFGGFENEELADDSTSQVWIARK
jgi:SAM-dependent methyltransferase